MSLDAYIRQFRHLHVSRSKGVPAPHKPVLLISVIDEVEGGRITSNKIYITPELVATFKENWSALVDSKVFEPRFALPFYHLDGKGKKNTDHFWHLVTFPGSEIALTSSDSIRSFAALKIAVDYATVDEELFLLFCEPKERTILRAVLLDTYFPLTKGNYLRSKRKQGNYISEIENKLLNEAPEKYKLEIAKADEEEIFLRGGTFKKIVPRIYNYTCCISGLRIDSTSSVQMIDACHIIPFSESHDDTITNGISLCPNLHRAFDRGLISIDDNYRVVVSNAFVENESEYSIKQFEGKLISLPDKQGYLPSKTGLASHRVKWKFG